MHACTQLIITITNSNVSLCQYIRKNVFILQTCLLRHTKGRSIYKVSECILKQYPLWDVCDRYRHVCTVNEKYQNGI